MFPFFETIYWIIIYTFWLTLTICFFMFIWMLKKLSVRLGFDYIIFKKNILWYFLWVFVFSRLFYIIGKWHEYKHIKDPLEFFVMNDYNFSLAWAIIWFLVVFFITSRIRRERLDNFIDWLTISLFFILTIWFIWALLGWQVYGRETHLWIEIIYSHPFTPVPEQVPLFPLPIIYSILFFIMFSISYISSMYVNTKWVIWYVWLIAFSSVFLIFEGFSWKYDIFKTVIWMNIMQLFSIALVLFWFYRLFLVLISRENKETVILN